MDWILVGIGGALGSILRFLTVSGALRMFGAGFPAGTLIVNVLGSLVMGIAFVLLIERGGSGRAALLIMTGALGGFTTFSAFFTGCLRSVRGRALGSDGRLCRPVGSGLRRGPVRRHPPGARRGRMSGVQVVTTEADAEGQRLDRWFRKRFPHVSQGRIEKMCRKGEIRVEGGRVKASTRLEAGQSVRVPPVGDASPRPKQVASVGAEKAEMIRAAVIHRDADIIVLNKPPGLAVQGGTRTSVHVDGLSEALRFDADDKPKLVHRLDKDTSGLLMLARHGRAAAALAKAMQSRATRKIYWAAVAGVPSLKAGTVRYGLVKQAGHGPHGSGEKMVCIHPDAVADTPGAKHAVSDYKVLENVAQRAAWVALVPVTGRTHQLRAHMAEIGHPVVGDGKYGTNRQVNEGDGWGAQLGGSISRKLHLHARTLTIRHPAGGHQMTFTAPLPDHMAATWEFLGWDAGDHAGDPFGEDI